jgi:hypothetical protein
MYGIILETGQLYIRQVGTDQVIILECRHPLDGSRRIYDVSNSFAIYTSDAGITAEEAEKRLNPAQYGFRACKPPGREYDVPPVYAESWDDTCGCTPPATAARWSWSSPNGVWFLMDSPDLLGTDWEYVCRTSTERGLGYTYERTYDLEFRFAAYFTPRICRAGGCNQRDMPLSERYIEVEPLRTTVKEYGGDTFCLEALPAAKRVNLSTKSRTFPYQTPLDIRNPCVLRSGSTHYRIELLGGRSGFEITKGDWTVTPTSQGDCHRASMRNPGDECKVGVSNATTVTGRSIIYEGIKCENTVIDIFHEDDVIYRNHGGSQIAGLSEPCPNVLNGIVTNSYCEEHQVTPMRTEGKTVTDYDCYGWIIDHDKISVEDPDSIPIKLGVIDSYRTGFSLPNISVESIPPYCGSNVLFRCISNRLDVSGVPMASGIKIVVVDAQTSKVKTLTLSNTANTTYSARCCDGYWELYKTPQNGDTSVDLYWLGEKINSWTNTSQNTYRFSCQCSYGVLRKNPATPNETVDAVYGCGQDITSTIHNVQGGLQINCCDDYAVISTGKWSMKYDINVVHNYSGGDYYIDHENSYAYLSDGTRCVPGKTEMEWIETVPTQFYRERIVTWITDDEYQWEVPHPHYQRESSDIFSYVTAHLPFRCNIENNRWAALYRRDHRIIVDRRLTSIECLKCGDDTFALCPIMDDMDLQQWHIEASYNYNTGLDDPLADECHYWGDLWFSRWIHNPQSDRRVPNLTEADKNRLAAWLDAYPMMGIYVALNGKLVSMNPGAESKGGHDIQEKMPPEGLPFTPSGDYWYINDRNAAVRGDKQIEQTDQAWNHNCNSTAITLSAQSLDDIPAAPAVQCKGKHGRVVLGGNGVLAVFDSNFGRMDFSTSTKVCRLR